MATLAAAECAGGAAWCVDDGRRSTPRCASSSAGPSASSRRVKHRCADMLVRRRAGPGRGVGRRARARRRAMPTPPRSRLSAAAAGAIALDAFADRGQGLHPGARRHRLHLGARRPPLPAPGHRPCASSSAAPSPWRAAVAARRRRRHAPPAHPRRCPPRPRRSAPRSRAVVDEIAALPKDERRAALADAGLHRARTGRRRGDATPAPSSSSSSTRSCGGPRSACRTSQVGRLGRARPSPPTARPSSRSAGCGPRSSARSPGASSSASPRPAPTSPPSPPPATRTDGGWLLNGQKVWTSMAKEADWGICLARTNPDGAEAPRHHLLHRRHAHARASTSGRCGR